LISDHIFSNSYPANNQVCKFNIGWQWLGARFRIQLGIEIIFSDKLAKYDRASLVNDLVLETTRHDYG